MTAYKHNDALLTNPLATLTQDFLSF